MVTQDQINQWYQQLLGRSPQPGDYESWTNGTYTSPDSTPDQIYQQIYNSGEAQAYRARTTSGPAAAPQGPNSPAPSTGVQQPPPTTTPTPTTTTTTAPGGYTVAPFKNPNANGSNTQFVGFSPDSHLGETPTVQNPKYAVMQYLGANGIDPASMWAQSAADALNKAFGTTEFHAIDGQTLGYGDEYVHSAPANYGIGKADMSGPMAEFIWGASGGSTNTGGPGGPGTTTTNTGGGLTPPGGGLSTGPSGYGITPSDTGGVFTNWDIPFVPPDAITEQNDPGFQAREQLGQEALERSAAAKGTLLTGGTLKDTEQFAQDYASNEYANVYSRALGEYQQAYNIFNQQQTNQFNRLASLAGLGQTAAGQLTSAAGQFGATGANLLTNIGNSQAAGIVGSANAYGTGLSNIGGLATLPYLLSNSGYGAASQSGAGNPMSVM